LQEVLLIDILCLLYLLLNICGDYFQLQEHKEHMDKHKFVQEHLHLCTAEQSLVWDQN